MSKFLSLSDEPGEDRWTLADDVDTDDLRKELAAAMDEGRTAHVRVKVTKHQTGELLVNGRAVKAAMVWEAKATDPTFSIID
jgi:hypothetical protein